MMAGAFPGSASNQLNLSHHRAWFDLALLQFAISMRKHNAHFTMEGLTASLFDMHQMNVGKTLASQRIVKEQLENAIEKYERSQLYFTSSSCGDV